MVLLAQPSMTVFPALVATLAGARPPLTLGHARMRGRSSRSVFEVVAQTSAQTPGRLASVKDLVAAVTTAYELQTALIWALTGVFRPARD